MVVAEIHAALRAAVKPGVTPKQLDGVAFETIKAAGAEPNFLDYEGFPASTCISVNDTVVHGIPDDRPLESGDLVSFDCGAYVLREGRQWHGDAAFTMVVGGDAAAAERDLQLSRITETAMWAGIAALWGARTVRAVGFAIEETVAVAADEHGWEAGIVAEYVGHGIGNEMHQDPPIPNYVFRGHAGRLRPGMCVCVEPIFTARSPENRVLADNWTVRTVDGSRAAHWEHQVAITADGLSVLTAPDFGRAGLASYGVPVVEV